MSKLDLASKVGLDADRCVACGLCLPHCPTYREMRTENESPRGRIALMRALAREELAATAQLESHLALCLTCRNCERVCPAKVNYGRLIDHGRALLEVRRQRPLVQRLSRRLVLDKLIARPARLRWLAKMFRAYQVTGLQKLARASGLLWMLGLRHWDSLMPRIPAQLGWQQTYPAPTTTQGSVALFTGCVANVFDRVTLAATIEVLNALGYKVMVPRGQVCCGALHQHSGEIEKAMALMRRNVEVFNAEHADVIVTTASGCGAMLSEYSLCLPEDERAAAFSIKIKDVSQFLLDVEWPTDVTLAPLDAHVAIHDPCTLANVLRDAEGPYRLLQRIPGIRLLALPENDVCCGAAGVYFLTQPEMASTLRARKLDALAESHPDTLVTSNVGCAMHLQQAIQQARLEIEVSHPIVLIARQLRACNVTVTA
ncbi:MAG: (Fe-S)-binding protein [Acidiferrobacterales bacterium]